MFEISTASGVLAANKGLLGLGAFIVLGSALGGYAIHEHNTASTLAVKNAETTAALDQTRHELTNLTARVNTLVAQAQKPSPYSAEDSAASPPPSAAAHHAVARHKVSHVRRPDPYLRKLQAQLDAQGKAIAQTQSELASTEGNLANTRTELSGSIAHTHNELVVLERKGQRRYTEFDIYKAKQFSREGPFGVRLRKANVKHQYADLELLVDDRSLTQKHINLYQPVTFSTPEYPQPVQVVINQISKNHIHGYVSAPRYNQSELAAMANGAAPPPDQQDANGEPTLHKRLPLP